MPAAVVAAVIAGGAGVASSVISSKAASGAAKQQEAAGGKALEQFAPYTSVGGAAMQTLGGLMGLPSGPSSGAPAAATAPEGFEGATAADLARARFKGRGQEVADFLQAKRAAGEPTEGAKGRTMRDLFQQGARQQTQSGYQPPTPANPLQRGKQVQMQAPTGETALVDESEVPRFEQMGARVIGGG